MPARAPNKINQATVNLKSMIFLGDLIRAYLKLKPNEQKVAQMIAEALGFDWQEKNVPSNIAFSEPQMAVGSMESAVAPEIHKTLAPRESVPMQESPKSNWVRTALVRKGVFQLNEPLEFVLIPPSEGDKHVFPPPYDPLFLPSWTRAILSSALTKETRNGPIDIEKIIETFAKRQALARLPLFPGQQVSHQVQILVDKSEGMFPFLRDQGWLTNEISKVAGKENVQILNFRNSPLSGVGTGALRNWKPYASPTKGTLVVILSGFGISEPPFSSNWVDYEEWFEIIRRIQNAECSAIAFVPFAPERWPREIQRIIKLLPWNRTTTVSEVRKLLGLKARHQ